MASPHVDGGLRHAVFLALAVTGVVVVSRIFWGEITTVLLRLIDRREVQRERRVPWRQRFVTAWAGFRGAVSLAAALAVPTTTLSGAPFPDRSMLIFVVVVVILVTVLVQGTSLPAVVRWARMPEDVAYAEELQLARCRGVQAALEALPVVAGELGASPKMLARLQKEYEEHAALVAENGDGSTNDLAERNDLVRRVRLGVLEHKRRAITTLRNQRVIDDLVLRELQSEMDLEEVQLLDACRQLTTRQGLTVQSAACCRRSLSAGIARCARSSCRWAGCRSLPAQTARESRPYTARYDCWRIAAAARSSARSPVRAGCNRCCGPGPSNWVALDARRRPRARFATGRCHLKWALPQTISAISSTWASRSRPGRRSSPAIQRSNGKCCSPGRCCGPVRRWCAGPGPFAEAANSGNGFDELSRSLPLYRSVLAEYANPHALPELAAVRERLRGWRFYDGFRVDGGALARHPQVGTRTPVLSDDGSDLAAAIQTILESGSDDLRRVVADAFDGATIAVAIHDGLFDLQLRQRGMLRPLRAAELSDGTLRFLLWAAALLSPQAPSLMVLNEPETSLHPDLVRPLASLIRAAAQLTQVVVVTHSRSLLEFLDTVPVAEGGDSGGAVEIELYKDWGETRITGQGLLTTPRWDWGKR